MASEAHRTGAEAPAGYRPDIDGLRALAVLAVIGFHIAPGRLPGGFIGVDIFFVISGFLISSIIVRELDSGTFSFLAFYRRRIRRIFPALFIVLTASLAAAWLLLPDRDFERFGLHLAASAAFIPNVAFWNEAGYFDVYPYSKPLLHLWSLGVEEQYYALWPLFLFLCWRSRIGLVLPIVLVASASFALCLYLSQADPIAAFYSPLTRFWELLLGAVPLLLARRGLEPGSRLANLCSFAGLAAVAAGLGLIDSARAFPGWWALLPTLGTMLIILGGARAWPNARLLALRPMVWVGLISYPLYLWHWPLLSFGHYSNFETLPFFWRAAAAGFALPLAWATYRLVELPVRRMRPVPAAELCTAMALIAGAGIAIWASAGAVPGRPAVDPKRDFLSLYRNLHADAARQEECSFGSPTRGLQNPVLPPPCIAAGSRQTWLLWGDSHARGLAPGLESSLPDGVSLARIATGGCPPALPGAPGQQLALCRHANDYALAQIKRLRPAIVILTQRGDYPSKDWEALAGRIRNAGGGRIVLVGPTPQYSGSLPIIVARRHWPDVPDHVRDELAEHVLAEDREMVRRFGASPDLDYVSLVAKLCTEAGCRARVPGPGPARLMVSDYGHLSPWGSAHVARTILLPALAGRDSRSAARR